MNRYNWVGKKYGNSDSALSPEGEWVKYSDARELEGDVKFLLNFAPKDCPEGLDPTFYHTGSYRGDKQLQDRIDQLRKGESE